METFPRLIDNLWYTTATFSDSRREDRRMCLPVYITQDMLKQLPKAGHQGPNGKWAGEIGRRRTQADCPVNKSSLTHKPHLKHNCISRVYLGTLDQKVLS